MGNFLKVSDSIGIVGHVFGSQLDQVADFVSTNTGIDKNTAQSIMQIAAPIAMGLLGKQQREQGLNAQGLSEMLNTSVQDVEKTEPQNMGLIGKLTLTETTMATLWTISLLWE